MDLAGKNYLGYLEQDKTVGFCRSVIEGVEIKICNNNPHSYKPHIHNELSLGYILDGSTELTMNDKTIHYEAGDGVIIPPLMSHRCAPNDRNHWAYVMLFVDPAYYRDLVSFNQAIKITGIQAEKLKGFIEQLLRETVPDTLENILIELLMEFGEKGTADITTSDADEIAKSIHDYIIEHVNEEITLEQLEQLFGLNKFSIIKNFKKLYITTPAAFHLQYRVSEAKRLLSKGADVFDICEEFRFYDQSHFIREYKKMYGITPGSYAEQLKGELT